MYLDANNLYGCPMTGKLPIGNCKWVKNISKIDEEFIKNYDENDDIGYFLKVDIEYHQELYYLHIDLPFLPEKMEINGYSKLVCTQYDKKIGSTHKKHTASIKAWFKAKKKFIKQLLFIKKYGLNHILR